MAILNHGSTIRTADGGQSATTIVTASNIGTYGVAANSTYYVGTTQNVFNRASGAQTLTGVSIDGNAANITAYTINQNVGSSNSPTFATLQLTRLNFGADNAQPWTVGAGGTAGTGLTFGGDYTSSQAYKIFTAMENVGGNYSKLTLNWHTGIRIGAYYGYGGTRFYNNLVGEGTEIFSVGNADSNVRVVNNIYAQSFYDITNTAYYIDAASTSNLVGLTVANTITGSVSGNAGTATILQTARTIGGVSFNGSAAINLPGVNTAGNQNTSGTSSNITAYTINQNVGTANTPSFAGIVSSAVTGYAYLQVVDVNNFWITPGNVNWGLYFETIAGGLLGGSGDSNRLGFVGAGAARFYVDLNNGNGWFGGSLTANTDSRAPIFYDSNDTAYYVDPASNSRLLNLGLGNVTPDLRLSVSGDAQLSGILYLGGTAGSYGSWGSRTYTTSGILYNNSSSVEFNNYGYGSTWTFTLGGGNATSSGSFRAPIFYDSDNTAYYLDAANSGTSLLVAGKVGIGTTSPTSLLHLAGVGGDGVAFLRIAGTASDAFNWGSSVMYANLAATETAINLIGKAQSQYNCSYIGYRHVADGSALNMLSLGLYAADHLVNILGNGNVGIGTTSPANKLHVVGSAYSDTDFRAPIFYDSNDTGYFLNPNSTSNLNNLRAATISAANHGLTCVYYGGGATPTNGYLITTNIDYSTFNMPTVIIEGYAYGNGVPIHLEIVWYAYNNSWTNLSYTNLGAWNPGTVSIGTNASGKVCLHLSSLIYYGRFNVRCIYDQGNAPLEGWTVTDATTSALTRVTTISKVELATSITGNAATVTNGLYTSSTLTAGNLSGTIPSGVLGNSAHFIGTTSIALNRGSASQTLTGVSIDGNAATATNGLTTSNYVNYSAFTSSLTSTVDVRAPIFYDSNDTTYYTDPSSLSNILELKTNKNWYDSSASAWGGGINIGGNSPSIGFQSTSSTWWYMLHHSSDSINFYRRSTSGGWNQDCIWDNSGNFIWRVSSIRAPIFYDFNNTAYYLDPASTSVLNALTIGGNTALTTASTLTAGNLSGTIPSGVLGNSTHYVGTTAIALNRASAGQTLTGISIDGNSGGIYAAGQAFIQTTSAGTSYVQHIQVREAAGGGGLTSEIYAPALGFHWSGVVASNILMESSGRMSIRNNPGTGYENFIANIVYGNSSVQTPILYDSANTAYYLDPASTSILDATRHNSIVAGSTSGMSSAGAIAVYSAGSPYISFHDGTTARTAYFQELSGRFYFGEVTYTESEGSFRAPLFYDSNNTAYYTDPASTSNLLGLTVTNTITGSISGNAGTATILQTARTIGGVSFNGSASINLPGVNTAGNQNTSGSSASCTGNAATASNSTQFGGEGNTNFMRGLTSGTEANLDTYTDNGFRSITYTGYSRNLLSFNPGGSTGTVQHEYYYNIPSSGWRVRNKTDNITWSAWGNVVMTDTNQGALTGTVITTTSNTTVSGLNIGGNAATAYGLNVHTGRNNEVNKVVRTDGSGYIQAGWINTDSGDSGFANRLTRITCSTDNYLRYLGLTDFKVSIGGSAKNNYSRRVDYSSDANYHVGSFGHNGYGANETFHGGSGFIDIWDGTNYPSGLTHIHGFNALHYTTNSLGTTGGTAYGWQMVAQYNTDSGPWWRRCSGGSFGSWFKLVSYGNNQSGDIYAQRYYDNDNTVYYTDPASTSNLLGLTVINTITGSITGNAGGSSASCTGNAATASNSTQLGGNAAANFVQGEGSRGRSSTRQNGTANSLTDPSGFYFGTNTTGMPTTDWWNWMSCIGNSWGSPDGYGYQLAYSFWSDDIRMRRLESGTWRSWISLIHTGNYNSYAPTLTGTGASGSWGISVTGSSASCTGNSATTTLATKATRANGNFYIDDNYGNTVVGVYSASRYQGVFAMGDSYKLAADGTTTGNLYGIAWSHQNAGGAAGNLASHGLLILENGVFKGAWGGGSLRTPGDVRGTLFYDWDNTGYYCDPASTSNLNAITAAGNITAAQYYTANWFRSTTSGNGLYNEATGQHFYSDDVSYWNVASSSSAQGIRLRTGGHAGTVRGYFYADTANDVGLLNQSGSWRVRVVGGDYVLFDGSSVRAQIFYDSNDTGYYTDPAGTSILNVVRANSYVQKSASQSLSGTVGCTIDVAAAGIHVLTLAASTTISSFTYNYRAPNPSVNTIMLVIKYGGTASITWTNVLWANGITPTITGVSGYADVYMLTSYQGTTGVWIGTVVAQGLVSTSL